MRRLVVGLLALIGFLVVILVIAGAGLWYWAKPGTPRIADATILTLDLTAGVPETSSSNEIADLLGEQHPSLRDVLDGLERAGDDPRIKGLVARVGEGGLGLAEVQELRDAVASFRAKGKPAVAYADSFGEFASGTSSYYLAAAFDEIWVQPFGMVGLIGLRAEQTFFRGTLNSLGIVPSFDHRSEYKTAMNMLTETRMTAPQREETEALLHSVYNQIVRGIAVDRKLDDGEVRSLADRGPLLTQEALQAHLIDHIGYRDEAIDALQTHAGHDAQLLSLARYLGRAGPPHRTGPTIALIHAAGLIQRGDSDDNPLTGGALLGADTLAHAFREAARDPSVRAILFRIDSPGGSAVASETIWRETVQARQAGKPVIVSMGDVAGSGGYYIAAAADKIVAEPATLTGSIGVVAGKLVLGGLLEKLGVSWGTVQIGANAAIFSALEDFSPQGHQRFEAFLDEVYAGFKQRVVEGRHLSPDAVEQVARGRVWTGEEAKTRGLVDALGGYQTALALAKQAAGIAPQQDVTVRVFPPPRSIAETIVAKLFRGQNDPEEHSAAASVAFLARTADALRPLLARLQLMAAPPGALVMPPVETR